MTASTIEQQRATRHNAMLVAQVTRQAREHYEPPKASRTRMAVKDGARKSAPPSASASAASRQSSQCSASGAAAAASEPEAASGDVNGGPDAAEAAQAVVVPTGAPEEPGQVPRRAWSQVHV